MSTRDPDAGLSPEQRIMYGRIQKANDRLRNAKETAEERARERIREEIADLQGLRDAEVREAHALYEATKLSNAPRGLPTASIKRAMRTKDHVTVTKIWEGVDLSRFDTKEEVPSWVIDWDAKTGVINWFEWEGERTEGNLEITIEEDAEEAAIKGVKYLVSYNEGDQKDNPLVQVLAANEPYLALCREVDAAARKQYGR